mmetsp:Transcript_21506/g.46749  ORF Transcript_21506/g.46749 Transcript_21506/m.46749 type:complete len:655 (+) Transcript_21506:526-2490(+)
MGTGCVKSKGAAYEDTTTPLASFPETPKVTLPPKTPSVAELKETIHKLGIDIPPDLREKSELIELLHVHQASHGGLNNLVRQGSGAEATKTNSNTTSNSNINNINNNSSCSSNFVQPFLSGSPTAAASTTSPVGENAGVYCSSPSAAGTTRDHLIPGQVGSPKASRSVSELKKRLKDLGFKVPSSIVEKNELLALVEEAERQAQGRHCTSPAAPTEASRIDRLRGRLKELGVEVPDITDGEVLSKKLREVQSSRPEVTVKKELSPDITATCAQRAECVAGIDLESSFTPGSFEPLGLNSDHVVTGRSFKWVRGDCIGRGASGTVYKALNQDTGQLIAVKEVHMDLQRKQDVRFREALQTELKLLSELRHPNIVAYYGCDLLGSVLCMYLEFMAGGSVARVLDQFGPFEESLIADYGRQLLNGLEYLHTQSPYVVHRDIKGANVLLGGDCTVKLADFGCSKREEETRSLTIGGSIPWMAPEVIAHARYGRAGDIWSFGCLMLEMAAAKPPWGHFDNIMAAMIKIGMSSEMPSIPESATPMFRTFVRRCLARDPGRRLSATELLNERFLRGRGASHSACGGASSVEEGNLDAIDEASGTESDDESTDAPLPTGWEKHFDDRYKEWYYWHRPTGRSVWERPAPECQDEEDSDLMSSQ